MKTMNIVGKLFFIIFLFKPLFANVQLGCFEMDGSKIEEVGIGLPFLLKLEVSNIDNHLVSENIPGLNNPDIHYNYEGASSIITNINGKVTVSKTYSYSVYINKEGDYEFGPVEVKTQKDSYYSNKVQISVEKNSASFDSAKNYSLRLEVDKDSVYVGQEVNLKVTLILRDEIKLDHLSDMSLSSFDVRAAGAPSRKSETINNKKFYVSTWNYKIYPLKSGEIDIPYLSAIIKIPSQDNSSYSFAHFFMSYTTKRFNSNALTINVKETPQNLIAGEFDKFFIEIDKNKFAQNEGVLVKLRLVGLGNFSAIDINGLSGLDDKLKVYKSSTSLQPYKDYEEKIFEFILQADESGSYKIPAQLFKYFDITDEMVKTLKTKEILFEVVEAPEQEVVEDEVASDDLDSSRILLDCQNLNNAKLFDFDIPNWLFIVLIFLPILSFILFKIYIVLIGSDFWMFYRIKFNFSKAQKDLNYLFLYKSILTIVANKMKKPKESVTFLDMENLFLDSTLYPSWKNYLVNLYAIIFSKKDLDLEIKKNLFNNFKFWLKKLKKINLVLFLFFFGFLKSYSNSFCDYYNRGIKNYNNQNYIEALVNLKRARKLSNFSNLKKVDSALFNVESYLSIVKSKKISSYFSDFLKILSFGFLKILILIFLYLFILLLVFKRSKLSVFCLGLLILVSSFYFSKIYFDRRNFGLIVSSECMCYAGPGLDYHQIFNVDLVKEVKILKEVTDWFLIRDDKKNGWIEKKCVELI